MHKYKKLFCIIITLVLLACSTIGYSFYIEPKLLNTVKYKYKSNVALKNVRITFFSDTHFGRLFREEEAAEIVDRINESKPDAVIFGGDIIDSYYRDKEILNLEYLAQELSKINSKHKFAVLGNHDSSAKKQLTAMWEAAGFKLLINESVAAEELGLLFIGANDVYREKPTAENLERDTSLLPVLICHQPDVADMLMGDKLPLMLSGHTHGGQVLLPFLTKKALPRYGKNYRRGEFDVNGGKLFVSSGIGTSQIPVRFLNVPEIVTIDIEKGAQ